MKGLKTRDHRDDPLFLKEATGKKLPDIQLFELTGTHGGANVNDLKQHSY
jgi:hypothetical protein